MKFFQFMLVIASQILFSCVPGVNDEASIFKGGIESPPNPPEESKLPSPPQTARESSKNFVDPFDVYEIVPLEIIQLKANLELQTNEIRSVQQGKDANLTVFQQFSKDTGSYEMAVELLDTAAGQSRLTLYVGGKRVEDVQLDTDRSEKRIIRFKNVPVRLGELVSLYYVPDDKEGLIVSRVGIRHLKDTSEESGTDQGSVESIDTRGPKGELPLIPGATGYGMFQNFNADARVIKVTNLSSDAASGTLLNCVNQQGPRVCVFEVSGRIKYKGELRIKNPGIQIAGQTAPEPGITIQAHTTRVMANNVVIEHVRLMTSDELTNSDENDTTGYNNRNVMVIGNHQRSVKNIVLNHVSINFGIDGTLTTWYDVDHVTIRRVISGPMLRYSMHVDEGGTGWQNLQKHALSTLFGHETGSIDMSESIIAFSEGRNPRSGASLLSFYNNVGFNRKWDFASLYTRGRGKSVSANLVANVFIEGNEFFGFRNGRPRRELFSLNIENEQGEISLYHADNLWEGPEGQDFFSLYPQSLFRENVANGGKINRLSAPRNMPYGARVLPVNQVEAHVLAVAGPRPSFRPEFEKKLVEKVRGRKGDYINCYEEKTDSLLERKIDQFSPEYPSDRCELDKKGWDGWSQWLTPPAEIVRNDSLEEDLPSQENLGKRLSSGYSQLQAFLHACSKFVETGIGGCSKDYIDPNGKPW